MLETAQKTLPDTIPAKTTQGPTSLGGGVTLEWFDNGDMLSFVLTDCRRETVDFYINTNITLLNHWDLSTPMKILHDISHENVSLTPYFRQRLNEIIPIINQTGVHGTSAVVMSKGFLETVIAFFGNAFNRRTPNFKQRYFTDHTKALAWLKTEPAP
ncbi:MAG TPA: hypothetical protein PLZ51_10245 [Aggregatilineales bacterium]|nr:hypothetical protein [Aggregatilineales bacterium]